MSDLDAEGPGPEAPSRGLSWLMIVVGFLFLLPFLFVSAAEGGSVGAIFSALLTVGWTFGLGVVFLVYGWKRLQKTQEDEEG